MPVRIVEINDITGWDTTSHTKGHVIVIDDILGLFLLAILMPMISGGQLPSAGELSLLAAKIFGFFGIALVTGKFLVPRLGRLSMKSRYVEIEFSIALIVALILAKCALLPCRSTNAKIFMKV